MVLPRSTGDAGLLQSRLGIGAVVNTSSTFRAMVATFRRAVIVASGTAIRSRLTSRSCHAGLVKVVGMLLKNRTLSRLTPSAPLASATTMIPVGANPASRNLSTLSCAWRTSRLPLAPAGAVATPMANRHMLYDLPNTRLRREFFELGRRTGQHTALAFFL